MADTKQGNVARTIRELISGFALPAVIYFLIYAIFSWPLLTHFSSSYFCGDNDGYQNIWNIWWVHKAVVELHQSPWHTNYLHYPTGTSLIGHTLAPFDGFLGIALMACGMKLNQTYNAIVIFSFVMTGVTMFWLARRISGSYLGALFAGAAVTFSHFHFAQAQNHLQVMTLEWLPLAILAVHELLRSPGKLKAIGAAGAMGLVTLSDFHQAFFVILAGSIYGLIVFVRLIRNHFADSRTHTTANCHPEPNSAKDPAESQRPDPLPSTAQDDTLCETSAHLRLKQYVLPIIIFIGLFACTSGALFLKLMMQNRADPLLYAHDPVIWSTDVLDPIVPSAQWRFASLTRPIWSRSGGSVPDFVWIEHSLYIGWSVLILVFVAWVPRPCFSSASRRRMGEAPKPQNAWAEIQYWIALAVLFFLLSLGPRLHIDGTITNVPGIYPLLEKLLPPLKMAGMPMRLMAVVFIACAVLAAIAIRDIQQTRRGVWIIVALFALWIFESIPKDQPTMLAEYPRWVSVLHDLPDGPVLDTTYATNMFAHLYFATGHNKPVAEGYISRYPTSVDIARGKLRGLVDTRQFDVLHEQYGFRYLVIRNQDAPFKLLYQQAGENLRIYDLSRPTNELPGEQ